MIVALPSSWYYAMLTSCSCREEQEPGSVLSLGNADFSPDRFSRRPAWSDALSYWASTLVIDPLVPVAFIWVVRLIVKRTGEQQRGWKKCCATFATSLALIIFLIMFQVPSAVAVGFADSPDAPSWAWVIWVLPFILYLPLTLRIWFANTRLCFKR
eukprot:gnl/MRDRNA2_/MRDRNA2_213349_c0_seq1.p1 gnl/MRDRNA2_/MRDRNA2_213349_c0~~gnl/MRDRNA2_/MRDRNA2_213349_c0_seq1.p1  ORF type:complete len:183 (+),score=21.13 gnl/MRDRNA2_/MRDRNA2_213349_c0_seq1:82-549(+)